MTCDISVLILASTIFLMAMSQGHASQPGDRESEYGPRWHGHRWAAMLRQRGYDTSTDSLALALQDSRVAIMALRYIGATGKPLILDRVETLLSSDSVTIQSRAARLLAEHDHEEGRQWLLKWEQLSDDELLQLDGEESLAVANAAGFLAQRNDYRLGRPLRIVLPKASVAAARALAFMDVRNEDTEKTWVDAAVLARQAILESANQRPRSGYESLRLYIQTLYQSSDYTIKHQDAKPTPRMTAAFQALSEAGTSMIEATEEQYSSRGATRAIDYSEEIQQLTQAVYKAWASASENRNEGISRDD